MQLAFVTACLSLGFSLGFARDMARDRRARLGSALRTHGEIKCSLWQAQGRLPWLRDTI